MSLVCVEGWEGSLQLSTVAVSNLTHSRASTPADTPETERHPTSQILNVNVACESLDQFSSSKYPFVGSH